MTFFSALILGLVASVHCAGMCGGLQGAFQTANTQVIRSQQQASTHLILLNAGRILTYISLGALLSLIGFGAIAGFDLQANSSVMRNAAAILIILIGVQLIFNKQRPFQSIEGLGKYIWQRLNPFIRLNTNRNSWVFLNGMIWGFLPCGLVYGVLITSVFAADIESTIWVMAGFGMGTLPSMLLTGMLYVKFREQLSSSGVRYAGGLFFVLGGTLMLGAPYWVSNDFLNDYPVLLNSVFCFA